MVGLIQNLDNSLISFGDIPNLTADSNLVKAEKEVAAMSLLFRNAPICFPALDFAK